MDILNYTLLLYDPHGNIVLYNLKNAKKHTIVDYGYRWETNGIVQPCYIVSANLFFTLSSDRYRHRKGKDGLVHCSPRTGDILLDAWSTDEFMTSGRPIRTMRVFDAVDVRGPVTIFQNNGVIYFLGGSMERYLMIMNLKGNYPNINKSAMDRQCHHN